MRTNEPCNGRVRPRGGADWVVESSLPMFEVDSDDEDAPEAVTAASSRAVAEEKREAEKAANG